MVSRDVAQQGPWDVTVVDETGSTNADLLAAAGRGAPDRSVLMARHQTAGRGRLDRRWEAPAGANLLVSFLFRDCVTDPHVLTQRVALATRSAAASIAEVDAVLKWPNDLLVGPAKLAGILAQAQPAADGKGVDVVVGLGLNVGWCPDGGACLGAEIDPRSVLDAVLRELDALPADDTVLAVLYRASLATIGAEVRVEVGASVPGGDPVVIEGRAIDVEPDGRLVVLDRCGITHRLATGDVIHLRSRAPELPSP